MIKPKHKIDPEERVVPILYRMRDCVIFQIVPLRATAPVTLRGTITCMPEISPFGCYHVRTDKDEEWFVLKDEIIEKIGDVA